MNSEFKLNSLKHLFDENTIKILYHRHKAYVPSVVAILLSFVLFFFVILPQVQYVFSLHDKEKEVKDRIGVLEKNIRFLSSINETDLESKLKVVSLALPPEKDFTTVMSGISQASAVAGVSIGDFIFQLGNISSNTSPSTSKASNNSAKAEINVPSIEITLNISGGLDSTKRFVEELSKGFPLSDVKSIQLNGNSAKVSIAFFYRPFPPLQLDGGTEISPLSQKDEALIQTLSSSVNLQPLQDLQIPQ